MSISSCLLCWNNFYCFFMFSHYHWFLELNCLYLKLLYLWSFLKWIWNSFKPFYLWHYHTYQIWVNFAIVSSSLFSIFSCMFSPYNKYWCFPQSLYHRLLFNYMCICVSVNRYVPMWVQALVKARRSSSGPLTWHYKWLWTTILGCWEMK